MSKRPFARSVCLPVSFALASALVACGGSDNNSSPTTDAGTDSSTGDAPIGDAPIDSKTDAPSDVKSDTKDSSSADAPDTSILASGTKIVSGDVYINGITSDDQIVYTDSSGSPTQVVALAGGTPATLDAASQAAFVDGKVAFSLNTADTSAMTATLLAWTAASGVHTLASAVSYNSPIVAARDGSAAIYFDTITTVTGGQQVTMHWTKIDGTGAKSLLPSVFVATDGSCAPQVLSSSTGFVVLHCDVAGTGDAGDGGSGGALLDAVDADGTLRSLATNAQPSFLLDLDKSGANVVYATASGDLDVVPFSGGAASTVESGGMQTALLSDAGGDVLYTTGASALKKSPVGAPAPVSLLSSNAALLVGASPTLGAALYVDSTSNFLNSTASGVGYSVYSLFAVDTTAATPAPVTIISSADATIFGDAFTADGAFAMAQTGTGQATGTFDLAIVQISTGTKSMLTTDAYIEYAYGTGSKIIFNDAWDDSGGVGPSGAADLSTIDLSASTATPAKLAVGAEADFFLDSTKAKVVYSSAANVGNEGIYVYTLP